MNESLPNESSNSDEITLKELILKIQDFYKEILKNWLLVILLIIPLVSLFLYKAFKTPPKYSAELTFMVNEDEGGGIGGAMAILSQFGFGGGGRGGKFNLEKILELSKTRKIIQSALFKKAEINGKKDYIANHIIDIYDLHEEWEKSKIGLADFKYTHDSIAIFNLPENGALKALQNVIIGSKNTSGIYSTHLNEDTGIMTLSINSLSETLSIYWLNAIYDYLSQYYINKSIEKQQFTFDIMEQKVDSIRLVLNSAELRLANFKDSNRNLITKTAALKESRIQRNLQVLTIMYGEAIKNKEIAEFSLKNKTPFIQIIDTPIPPITPAVKSKIMAIILGGFLGGFIAVLIITIRKIIRDAIDTP